MGTHLDHVDLTANRAAIRLLRGRRGHGVTTTKRACEVLRGCAVAWLPARRPAPCRAASGVPGYCIPKLMAKLRAAWPGTWEGTLGER